MKKALGFIGCGNMARAMMGGILSAGILAPEEVMASDAYRSGLEAAAAQLGIAAAGSNREVVEGARILVLSVKPQVYAAVITEIAPYVGEDTVVVTIAPGQSLEKLAGLFGKDVKLVRTMPNTPAMVGAGMTALCKNQYVTDEEFEEVRRLFGAFGRAEVVAEHMMEAVVAVSGSSPAYVFIMIEAMADAAVREGMPRDKAYTFAAQAIYGSAKMVLESGLHPAALKDNVCSPAGTTIDAVAVLEEKGFRGAIMDAMSACAQKARSM